MVPTSTRLDKFFAFPFENYLGMLRKLSRKLNYPLNQVANRKHEKKTHFLNDNHYIYLQVFLPHLLQFLGWPRMWISFLYLMKSARSSPRSGRIYEFELILTKTRHVVVGFQSIWMPIIPAVNCWFYFATLLFFLQLFCIIMFLN